MRVKINQAGAFDRDGVEIQLGTVLTLQSEAIPAWLANKAEVVADDPAPTAVAVTNPRKRAVRNGADD